MSPLLGDTLLVRHVFLGETAAHPVTFCLSRCPPEALETARHRFLSAAEEARWQTLLAAPRRASHLLGRYCAKEAVAAHRDRPSRAGFEIVSGVFGQPLVRGPGTDGVQVSLAHSAGWGVAIAFEEEHPVGIDLERLDPDRLAVLRPHLTHREQDLLAGSSGDSIRELGTIWTVKEALAKALKTGLSTPLEIYELIDASWEAGAFVSRFASFPQYQAVGLAIDAFALGLAFPSRSRLGCSLSSFRDRFCFPPP